MKFSKLHAEKYLKLIKNDWLWWDKLNNNISEINSFKLHTLTNDEMKKKMVMKVTNIYKHEK